MPVTTPSLCVPNQRKPSLATCGLNIPSLSSTPQKRKRSLERAKISYQSPSCETDESEEDIPATSTSKAASKWPGPASIPEKATPKISIRPMTACDISLPQYNPTHRLPSFAPQVNATSQVHAGGGQPPAVPTVSPANEIPIQLPVQPSPARGTSTPVRRMSCSTTGNREKPIDLTDDSPNKRRRSQKSTQLYGMEQLMETWKGELLNEQKGQKQRKQRFEAERKEIKASDARIDKLEEKIENLAKTYENVKRG